MMAVLNITVRFICVVLLVLTMVQYSRTDETATPNPTTSPQESNKSEDDSNSGVPTTTVKQDSQSNSSTATKTPSTAQTASKTNDTGTVTTVAVTTVTTPSAVSTHQATSKNNVSTTISEPTNANGSQGVVPGSTTKPNTNSSSGNSSSSGETTQSPPVSSQPNTNKSDTSQMPTDKPVTTQTPNSPVDASTVPTTMAPSVTDQTGSTLPITSVSNNTNETTAVTPSPTASKMSTPSNSSATNPVVTPATSNNQSTVESTTLIVTSTPASPTNQTTIAVTNSPSASTNKSAVVSTVPPTASTNQSTVAITSSTVGPTTVAPTTVAPTTVAPTTVAPTTVAPTNQTTMGATTKAPNSTIVPVATDSGTQSSAAPTVSSTPNPSTVAPGNQFVYINELEVNKQGIFQRVEIQMSNQLDRSHYAIVMVDGNTRKSVSIIYLRDVNQTNTGFLTVNLNSSSSMLNQGIGIAIYDTNGISGGQRFPDDWEVSENGLVDALVIGKTYEGISTVLLNVLTPGMDPFILDPSKYGKDRTISRCSNDSSTLRSTEVFALINPSIGQDNSDKCTEMARYENTLSIKIEMDCGKFKFASNNTYNERLLHEVIKFVVKEVNRKCQCGITRRHILSPVITCCKATNLEMKFVAPNKKQDDEFLDSFKAFIKDTPNIPVQGHTYKLDQSCLNDCCSNAVSPLTIAKDNSKDIKVTVAVIVTLLVLFVIIVLVVYMYMRKKKYAVQQFRMSRLEEDEDDFDDMTNIDIEDHDEFVGGQEATFDLKP